MAKANYEEALKAYKASKAAESGSDQDIKPNIGKKGAIKEPVSKKDKKKSSPRKSPGDAQKFKSAEFVDTDDSSSDEDEKKVNL